MILQGSVFTQNMLGELTIYPPVTNFLQCICPKNYEKMLRVDKVIAMKGVQFFGPPYRIECMMLMHFYIGCLMWCLMTVALGVIIANL